MTSLSFLDNQVCSVLSIDSLHFAESHLMQINPRKQMLSLTQQYRR